MDHAPNDLIEFAGAIKLRVDTNTSSFGWIPATRSAMCKAAVPLLVATACCAPTLFATECSKRSTNDPTVETQLVSRHSLTYFHSLPRISGTQSGINSVGAGSLVALSCDTSSS